jgi:3-polyprenyl-4-hydroxybenzoate decarboxylase
VIFTDLRHYVSTLESIGQLKVIEGASCDLEIGALTEIAAFRKKCPAVVFDSIQGLEKGCRIVTHFLANRTRERLWIDEFPATTQISEELLKETNAKWGKVFGED